MLAAGGCCHGGKNKVPNVRSRCRRNGKEVRAERASYSAVVWKAEATSLEHSEPCVRERGEHLCPKSEPRRAQAGSPGACGKTSKPGRTWRGGL